jgi:hypothetical protein
MPSTTFRAATSLVFGGLLLLVSACSAKSAGDDTGDSSGDKPLSTATFAASAQTQTDIGVARWVESDTWDSSVLEGQDANGEVKTRATFHWTQTSEGRTVDIEVDGAHVAWKQRSSDAAVSTDGLDAFRGNAAAVAVAKCASADLPPPPSAGASSGLLEAQDLVRQPSENLIGPLPTELTCHDTFHPGVQDCLQRMISIGLTTGMKSFCVGRCLAGG